MPPNPLKTKKLYALLIGINGYSSNPLKGCVNDILAVNDYFQKLCASEESEYEWNPLFLLSPRDKEEERKLSGKGYLKKGASGKGKFEYDAPIRENIIAAFNHLKKADAKQGDQCLFYYSGHGAKVDVPWLFSEVETSPIMQALVCADKKRTLLLDKELGYLISEVLDGKEPSTQKAIPGVHFLALMDCCYSATITRKEDPEAIVRENSGPGGLPTEILGFNKAGKNRFYKKFAEGQEKVAFNGINHARYVNLSAAEETQEARGLPMYRLTRNTDDGSEYQGVFTYCLLEALNKNGTKISYQELSDRVATEVKGRVRDQNPIIKETIDADKNAYFLASQFKTPKRAFNVGYRKIGSNDIDEWVLYAGAINGIVPSTPQTKTTVLINGQKEVEVIKVQAAESLLDPKAMRTYVGETNLEATIQQMAFPKVKIGLIPSFSQREEEAKKKELKTAWTAETYQYSALNLENQSSEYVIRIVKGREEELAYILTTRNSKIPIFPPREAATDFLRDVEKVARFNAILQMSNPNTQIDRSLFQLKVKALEGFDFRGSYDVFEKLMNEASYGIIDPKVGVQLQHRTVDKKDLPPGIQLQLSKKRVGLEDYYVGALYLDHEFSIKGTFLPVAPMGGPETPLSRALMFNDSGTKRPGFPVFINSEQFDHYGISEVTDYVLFFISNKDLFDLSNFEQDEVIFKYLSKTRSEKAKGGGGEILEEEENKGQGMPGLGKTDVLETEEDWCTILVPVRIIREHEKTLLLGQGEEVKGNQALGLSITAPAGLSAAVKLTNESAVHRMQSRESNPRISRQLFQELPSFEGQVRDEPVLGQSLLTASDNYLKIMELMNLKGQVNENSPLLINPNLSIGQQQSIISIGYDETDGIYFPTGLVDEYGKIQISQLPKSTPGIILGIDQEDEEERDWKNSIKLYFQKTIYAKFTGSHRYDKLSLVYQNGKKVTPIVYHGNEIKDAETLATLKTAVKSNKLVLLIHGLFGETEDILTELEQAGGWPDDTQTVLTFDYENLNTDIQATAKKLSKILKQLALEDKQVTIVAHSMGGLLARWLIEMEKGGKYVDKLIQLGTPNAGSDMAAFRKKVFGWITLGLNGVRFAQKYMAYFSYLGRWGIKGHSPFTTLKQMSPGSEFLQILNGHDMAPAVPYYLIAGDTSEIEAIIDPEDKVFQQLWAILKKRGKYILSDYLFHSNEPNDLAVTLSSMQALPWDFADIKEPQCDHLRYFSNPHAIQALTQFLATQ